MFSNNSYPEISRWKVILNRVGLSGVGFKGKNLTKCLWQCCHLISWMSLSVTEPQLFCSPSPVAGPFITVDSHGAAPCSCRASHQSDTSPGGSWRWVECCRGPYRPCVADSKLWQSLFSAPQTSRYCQSFLPYVWEFHWFMCAPHIWCKMPCLVQLRSVSQPHLFLPAQSWRRRSILAGQLSQEAVSGWQWPRGCGQAVSVFTEGLVWALSVSHKVGVSWRVFDLPTESALVYSMATSPLLIFVVFPSKQTQLCSTWIVIFSPPTYMVSISPLLELFRLSSFVPHAPKTCFLNFTAGELA